MKDFFKLRFTQCQAEQPLQGIGLLEKQVQKKIKNTGNIFRKNLQIKSFY